jgi:hypothetical protein
MATHPTRRQQQARDLLAGSLLSICEAARLDDPSRLGHAELEAIARQLARLVPAFGLDPILARALERRCTALGLRSDLAELLTLLDTEVPHLDMLLLDDEAFREQVARLEQELGEVE